MDGRGNENKVACLKPHGKLVGGPGSEPKFCECPLNQYKPPKSSMGILVLICLAKKEKRKKNILYTFKTKVFILFKKILRCLSIA